MHDSITTIFKDMVAQVTSEYAGHPSLVLSLTAVGAPRSIGANVGLKVQVADENDQSDFTAIWTDSAQKWAVEVLDFGADYMIEVATADPRTALKAWMADVAKYAVDGGVAA